MSVNKVILVGNVGKDPETRYLDEGTAITKFPFATSETYRNRDGERITTTEWHNVVMWRGLAQVAEKYVRKGSQLYIEGRIKTRSYDDADGNRKYITEIVGDQMQLLGKRPDDQGDRDDQESGQSSGGDTADSRQTAAQGESRSQGPTQSQGQSGPDGSSGQAGGNQGGPGGSSGQAGGNQGGPGGNQGGPGGNQGGSGASGQSPSDDPFGSGEGEPDDLPF